MAKHRKHSVEFKRQVVQEFLAGESPHALAKRHGISRSAVGRRADATSIASKRQNPFDANGRRC
jgi:transposase-like protein